MSHRIQIFCIVILLAILSGCSSGNKFASSFGKRHYTKGFFLNRAGNTETAKRNSTEDAGIARRETVNRNSVTAGNRKSEATLPLFDADKTPVAIAPPVPEKENSVATVEGTAKSRLAAIPYLLPVNPSDSIKTQQEKSKTALHTAQGVFVAGIILIAIALSSLFLSSTATIISFNGIFIVGLILVALGVVLFALIPRKTMPEAGNTERTPPKTKSDPANEYTNVGRLGFFMSIGSIILTVICLLVVSSLLSSSTTLLAAIASFILLAAGVFIGLVGLIVSLILCEIAMHHNDAHPDLAKIGATISGIILGVLVSLILLSLV